MRRATLILSLLLAGCSTEREETSGWTLHAVEGGCAPASAAKPALLDAWGGPATGIDGMSCSLDEVLAISEAKATAEDACCYTVTCADTLSAVDQITLFDAACHPQACDKAQSTVFTRDDVKKRLAARLPRCSLADPAPATRSTLQCVYTVTARYSCSTLPG